MSITYKQLLKLRDVLESHQDEGPGCGGGWASNDLGALRGYFSEIAVAADRLALCTNMERYRFELTAIEVQK